MSEAEVDFVQLTSEPLGGSILQAPSDPPTGAIDCAGANAQ
jgi:hypothetical protein